MKPRCEDRQAKPGPQPLGVGQSEYHKDLMGEIQKLKGKLAEAVARGKENEMSHAAMISRGEALRPS